jgi:hypothetical protein
MYFLDCRPLPATSPRPPGRQHRSSRDLILRCSVDRFSANRTRVAAHKKTAPVPPAKVTRTLAYCLPGGSWKPNRWRVYPKRQCSAVFTNGETAQPVVRSGSYGGASQASAGASRELSVGTDTRVITFRYVSTMCRLGVLLPVSSRDQNEK